MMVAQRNPLDSAAVEFSRAKADFDSAVRQAMVHPTEGNRARVDAALRRLNVARELAVSEGREIIAGARL